MFLGWHSHRQMNKKSEQRNVLQRLRQKKSAQVKIKNCNKNSSESVNFIVIMQF